MTCCHFFHFEMSHFKSTRFLLFVFYVKVKSFCSVLLHSSQVIWSEFALSWCCHGDAGVSGGRMWGSQSPHEVDRSHDQGRGDMASTHNSDSELHAISPRAVHHGEKKTNICYIPTMWNAAHPQIWHHVFFSFTPRCSSIILPSKLHRFLPLQ